MIALVREHLKPGEFYKKKDEVGDGAFRRLARKCELDLLYRVASADSLGRNAEWVPREKWYDAEAQEWFISRAKELEVAQAAPNPILLGRHLLELGVQPGPLMGETNSRGLRDAVGWTGSNFRRSAGRSPEIDRELGTRKRLAADLLTCNTD